LRGSESGFTRIDNSSKSKIDCESVSIDLRWAGVKDTLTLAGKGRGNL
jgi:hypothetical protein